MELKTIIVAHGATIINSIVQSKWLENAFIKSPADSITILVWN